MQQKESPEIGQETFLDEPCLYLQYVMTQTMKNYQTLKTCDYQTLKTCNLPNRENLWLILSMKILGFSLLYITTYYIS